jgi:tetratricopeptide (TPR) repeat protein
MKIEYMVGAVACVAAFAGMTFLRIHDFGGPSNLPVNDPGAGRLAMNISDCYRAKLKPGGKVCIEPALTGAGASAGDHVAARLARAVFDIDMQEPQKALKEVDAALAIDGDNVEARHMAARIALTVGDIDRAEREISIARRLAPNNARIGTTYASILIGRQANREAVGVYDDVIRRHPTYLFARLERAHLFAYLGECCSRGNYQVALDDYNYLIRHGAPDSGLLSQRANVLMAMGKPEPAISDLTAAMKANKHAFSLRLERADAYALLGRDDLAVEDYDAVLAEAAPGVPLHIFLPDQWAKILVARAFSLMRLQRFDDAANDVVKAIRVGGKQAILRAQVMLRRHGFPDVPIDGEDSPKLHQALSACFGLKSCSQPVMQAI